jgi:ATP-binding protein involved in chromosome partitioning
MTEQEIREALPTQAVGRVKSITSKDRTVTLVVDATGLSRPDAESLEAAIRARVEALEGIDTARIALMADKVMRRIVAVGSGKGGVGKSTVAVNLAAALAARGLSVGLLDADVYGPSMPTMLGVSGKPEYRDGMMEPHRAHGLRVMSVGLLTEKTDAMVWRGPMASQAITQMLTQTRWGTEDQPLDILVVDLPPGTGDVQLTLIQKTPLDGAIIVSTPQEVALADARRAHALFGKVKVPTLGLIENMSGDVFGRGGAEAEAERLGVPFLGDLPLDAALRQAGDAGTPLVTSDPDGAAARRFVVVAARLADVLGV